MSSETRDTCAKVFALIDVQGKGTISRDQLPLALRMLNYNPIDSEIEKSLAKQDAGAKNNDLTYDSFYKLVAEKLHLPSIEEQKIDIRNALAFFDTSQTGVIDKDIFIAILTELGEMKTDQKEAELWVDTLDRHKDGKLRICELEELFVNDEDLKTTLNGQTWDLV